MKIFLNIFSKIVKITQWLFLIAGIGIYILIIIQGKLNFNQGGYLLELICGILLTIGITIELLTIFIPLWLQIICLPLITYFYYTHAYQFLSSFNIGVDPNFIWTLPDTITNFVGFKIQGKVIDFIFWLGLVYFFLMLLLLIQSAVLSILAKFNVNFISEISQKGITIGKRVDRRSISPKRKKIIITLAILFTIFSFVGGIYLGTLEEKKYPTVWQYKFPCTSVLLINTSVGKKGTLDPSCIKPGTSTTVNFTLSGVENKKMLLEVDIWPQTKLPDPKFAVEVELKGPDKKTLFYISKDQPFTGVYNTERVTPIKGKYYFTAPNSGEYTIKVTPYDYYISQTFISIHHIRSQETD